jgi:hypothetical protein
VWVFNCGLLLSTGFGRPVYPNRLVELEVLTAVVMKSSVFWGETPYSLLKVNGSFGRTCRLHLQSRRISLTRNQHDASRTALRAGLLLGLFFDPEDEGNIFLRNVGLLSTDYTISYSRRWNSTNTKFVFPRYYVMRPIFVTVASRYASVNSTKHVEQQANEIFQQFKVT